MNSEKCSGIFQKKIILPPQKNYEAMKPAKYRITFTVRDSLMNRLIEERIIEDGITDVNLMSYKFYGAIKAFRNVNIRDIENNPDCNYYVEVLEVCNTETKRIAFATV